MLISKKQFQGAVPRSAKAYPEASARRLLAGR